MGNLHGKERNVKCQASHHSPFKTTQYDTSWIDTIERSFVVVWCDGSIGSNTNSNDDTNTLMQLARIVNKKRQLIHTFNEINACRDFITHVNNICLIISGQLGQELIPQIHNLDQLHSIYIFCMNKPKYEQWAKQYEKIRGVYTDIKEICECLKRYFISQSSSELDHLQFDLLNKDITLPTKDKQELSFIYPILSKIILLNMNSVTKQDMINYCRIEFTSDYHIQLINDYEHNSFQHDAIWWFTRDNFFQGIINRALQIHDFYTLCRMNPFIKELDFKLSELYRQQRSASSNVLHLYSSQSILIDDFAKLKLNQGGLMCINQFLFANTEQIIALMFIEHQNPVSGHTSNVNILFRISISETMEPNVSYANIGSISEFVHEKEYLISMSSIYRVGKIEKLVEIPSAWIVNLTLIDKNDLQLINLRQFTDQDKLSEHNQLGLTITNKLYLFKSTRKLFEHALHYKTKQIRSIILHYNMGIIYDCINEYNKALDEYTYAIKLTRDFIPNGNQKDNLCLVPLYSNMGLTYQQIKRSNHAFDHAWRALGILSKDQENSRYKKEISASCYFILGLIHVLQGKISNAQIYYEQALKDRCEYLSIDHPDVTSLQDLITSLSSQENIP